MFLLCPVYSHKIIKPVPKLFTIINFCSVPYCVMSVSMFHFQNNCKPLEELKVSTVQDGVKKEFPALVSICKYMNINIFLEYIRNYSSIF